MGNADGVNISANSLALTNGARVSVSTIGRGNAGNLSISTTESIFVNGSTEFFRSGITANAFNFDGNGGNVNITTGELTIENGGTVEATNFDNIGNNDPGTGQPGNITIAANGISLETARIEAATQSEFGQGGVINLQVTEDIIFQGNSFISAQAFENADGGDLVIDTRFIIAFPDGGNDIIASAEQGLGGSIFVSAEAIFGFEFGPPDPENPQDSTNRINASSDFDGNLVLTPSTIFDIDSVSKIIPVDSQQTIAEACQANREEIANSGLTINGKGGIVPEPGEPLDSLNVIANGEKNTTTSTIPSPIETAQGKIQPARGVTVTKSGEIILTAYRTDNTSDRISKTRYCG